MEFPDLMVDLETTGLDPSFNAVIQIAAVRFNYDTKQIGPVFDRCLSVPGNRFWDEGTRDWWLADKAELLQSILARSEDPGLVMKAFQDWVCDTNNGSSPTFWSKPTHFDFAFMQSYFRQFSLDIPFGYADAVDMNSFQRGLQRNPRGRRLDKEVPFDGTEHNALDDTFHQVKVVLMAEGLCSASS